MFYLFDLMLVIFFLDYLGPQDYSRYQSNGMSETLGKLLLSFLHDMVNCAEVGRLTGVNVHSVQR